MHLLLSKLLQKRGIKDIEELSKEEKEWFDVKERILSQPDEITIKDFEKFCKLQLSAVEEQWKNLDNSSQKNERLILLHNVYSSIIKAITASKLERGILEDYLEQLLK